MLSQPDAQMDTRSRRLDWQDPVRPDHRAHLPANRSESVRDKSTALVCSGPMHIIFRDRFLESDLDGGALLRLDAERQLASRHA